MDASRSMPSQRVTYAFQAPHGGPVKIGSSTLANVNSRLASVQTGHPATLSVVGVLEADREREFHNRWRMQRLAGEWFRPVLDMQDFFPNVVVEEAESGEALLVQWRRGFESGYAEAMRSVQTELINQFEQLNFNVSLVFQDIELKAELAASPRELEIRELSE